MTDKSINSNNFDNLQERNQQALNDISQLQITEQQLYDSLDNVSLTAEQKQTIIHRINEISQMRLNLYANLKDMYSFYQQNISASRNTSGEQIAAIDVIENELNESKRRMNLLQDQKYNKLRMVEINTYYGKRYNAHTKIMKTIVIFCVPIIILAILANNGILSTNIYSFLTGIIIIVAVVLLGYQLLDLSNRDNMNWDEYNWHFNQSTAPTATIQPAVVSPWSLPSLVCIGSECCYTGSTYDSSTNVCVPNSISNSTIANSVKSDPATVTAIVSTPTTVTTTVSPDSSTESFIAGVLSKYAFAQPVARLRGGKVLPSNAHF
jgi:hypothetical protein